MVVLTRQDSQAYDLLGHDVTLLDSLDRLDHLNDVDIVINLAGEPIAAGRWSESREAVAVQQPLAADRTAGGSHQALRYAPGCCSNASAIGWYGRQGMPRWMKRARTPHDEFTHRLCQRWGAAGPAGRTPQTRVCMVRIGLVLGMEGGPCPECCPHRLGLGGPMGSSGTQMMSWIHVRIWFAPCCSSSSTTRCDGIFNGTALQPVSNRAFSQTLAATAHRPHLFFVPAPLLRLLMGEAADLLLTGQQVLPVRLQQAGFHFTYPALPEALADLLRSPR